MKANANLLAVLLVGALSGQALAWNDAGHMTVAELTWRSLSDRERAGVSSLLRQHPHYTELLAAQVPAGVATNEWVFLKAATWPDLVRPAAEDQPPKPDYITRYHHGDWHYVNLPFVASADRGKMDPAAHPPGRTTVIERLGAAERLVKSGRVAASDRAVSLCWYLHLMGDLHQPLHCATWYSPAFPRGDRGGNEEAIKVNSVVMKLHAFWDEAAGSDTNYAAIARAADRIAADPALAPSALGELETNQTYASWAAESLEAAGRFAYLDGRLPYAPFQPDLPPARVPAVNRGYEKNARAVASRRVALAAFRLTQGLKGLF